MNQPAHKTTLQNRTFFVQFYPFTFTGKERDEETGYGYFGARYMDHELMTMWLSVDPLADKYPSFSPYAYCVWNPVKLVDPDGNSALANDDWYQNKETGAVLWREGHAREITRDGDVYENIGESFSKHIVDGIYENYYQNYLITIGDKMDAAELASRDKGLRTFLISNKSKLPMCHKQDLFNSHVASRGVSTPDMVGVQLSGSVVVGGGFTIDATLGYIKNFGIFLSISPGAGSGFDVSGGVGVCIGRCNSDYSSRESAVGLGYTSSIGYGGFYYQENVSVQRENRWNIYTYGVSIGSTTVLGGSVGVSYSF